MKRVIKRYLKPPQALSEATLRTLRSAKAGAVYGYSRNRKHSHSAATVPQHGRSATTSLQQYYHSAVAVQPLLCLHRIANRARAGNDFC